MTIRDDAKREAERLYGAPVADLRDDWFPSQRRSPFEAGAVWTAEQADREPSEPVHVQIAARKGGKHSTLADMIVERANARGIRVGFVTPDRELSDAEITDEAEALYPHNDDADPGMIIALRSAYRAGVCREGRAALLAAQEVRNRG